MTVRQGQNHSGGNKSARKMYGKNRNKLRVGRKLTEAELMGSPGSGQFIQTLLMREPVQ